MIPGFEIKTLERLQIILDLINSSPGGPVSWGNIIGTLSDQGDLQTALNAKQDTLVSGNNIKTINNSSILGFGNLTVSGLPNGGTVGQILTKNSSTDGDASWMDNYADWTSVVKHTVRNDGTAVIPKGTPVYVSGSNGTNMLVRAASNTSEATSSKTMGLTQSQLDTSGGSQTGFVVTEGLLGGLNTQGQTAGDPVWLGPNGTLIYGLANKPYAPEHLVFIGIVTKISAGSGEIFIKVQNGFELDELHNVDARNPNNNDGIFYNTSTSLWEHKSITTVLGYTPYSAANPNGYITSSALSGYLTSATAASTYYPLTNPSSYISGITSLMVTTALGYTPYNNTNPSGYITSSALSPYLTSATAASTYQTILPAASALVNGYLTSADWTTFNNKQVALVSGTNIKTVNSTTLLGSGDVVIPAGMNWMGAFPG